MAEIAYAVAVTFEDERTAEDWVRWLTGGHISDVLAGGATDAELIKLDGPGLAFEVRYHFPSREAFAAYERDHAPRLRGEAMERFPPDRGVVYRRSVAVLVARFGKQ
jgi:hypothetical protein